MTYFKLPILSSLIAIVAMASVGQAQTGPAVQAQTKLSVEEIRVIVKKLDPKAEEMPLNRDGKQVATRFIFKLRTTDTAQPLPAVIDVHDTVIWMSCTLSGPIGDLSKLPQNLLVEMLKSHVATGPSFFRLMNTEQGQVLQMGHRVDRTNMQRFANALVEFSGDLENTRTLWTSVK